MNTAFVVALNSTHIHTHTHIQHLHNYEQSTIGRVFLSFLCG